MELDALCSELEEALNAPQQGEAVERDWYNASLTELVHHIVDVHHVYMKAALPRLRTLVPTVLKAHGVRHGDMLRQVQGLFNALDAEISSHLLKEEQVLFPFIEAAESNNDPGSLPLSAPCGSVQYPIRQMEHEHESTDRRWQCCVKSRATTRCRPMHAQRSVRCTRSSSAWRPIYINTSTSKTTSSSPCAMQLDR